MGVLLPCGGVGEASHAVTGYRPKGPPRHDSLDCAVAGGFAVCASYSRLEH